MVLSDPTKGGALKLIPHSLRRARSEEESAEASELATLYRGDGWGLGAVVAPQAAEER